MYARGRPARSGSFRRRAALLALLFALPGCGGSEPSAAGANLLLITIDTARADALGAYGQTLATSPHIDLLAAEGVLFEQCTSSSPNTLPSHATLFTALQPFSHGVRSNAGYALSASSLTLAERLRERGYRTAAEVATGVLASATGIAQGFDAYRGVDSPDVVLQEISIDEGGQKRVATLKTRAAADITRQAIRFLRRQGDEPFFLWLHYYDPHYPYTAPEPFRSRFAASPYHGEIAYTDDQVGVVLEALAQQGLADRTLVALTSDHGEGLGEHGEPTHSFFVYETTLRVPLVLRGPELPRGLRIAAPVRLLDVAPTLLELVGSEGTPGSQGRSLLALLDPETPSLDLGAYGESIEFTSVFGASLLRSLRSGRWKYIHKVNPELFDLEVDPAERRNLARREPERLRALSEQLEALIEGAPAGPADAVVSMDRETRAGLIALGYAAATESGGLEEALGSLALAGPDPAAIAEDAVQFVQARGRLNFGAGATETAALFRALWERHPRSPAVLEGLVTALVRSEATAQTAPLLDASLALAPQNAPLFLNLSILAERSLETGAAIRALGRALELDPCEIILGATLGRLLRSEQRYLEEGEFLRTRLERCDSPENRNDYAWALATSPDPAARNGVRAVELAESVTSGPDGDRIEYLDTLAAAYAERGEFARAVELMQQVVERLEGQGAPEPVLAPFRAHRTAFEANEPLRYP